MKMAVGGGRYIGRIAQLLRKGFRAFERGSGSRWAETLDVCGAQIIGQARNERSFRADHDEWFWPSRDPGVEIKVWKGGEVISVEPRELLARDYVVEPDASSASYFLALAAIHGGEVTIRDLGSHRTEGP